METSSISMSHRSAVIERFLRLLPQDVAASLFAAISGGELDVPKFESAVAQIDWQAHRDVLEDLLREFLPIEDLVPQIHSKWRPVVRDGFSFIGARLSPERLAPKIVEQFTLDSETSVEERIFTFIRRAPVLQKIGQTLARNPSLDSGVRARLTVLEDGIREVDAAEIEAEIEKQMGTFLARHRVKVQPELYGEGSVSALLRFTRKNPQGIETASGIFKVLKPFINQYFEEDLALLAELADYFDANQHGYNLGNANLRGILDSVRELYAREIDFVNERKNLVAAARRFAGVSGIRVPRPIEALSTETITAMTEEGSVKITDAFREDPPRRRKLARKLIECLVARPLFSAEETSPFHADPHAGNLRVDQATGEIVLLDWALTGNLSVLDRRSLILLFVMLPLRDEGQILAAVSELSLSKDYADQEFFKRLIEKFIDSLPLASVPTSSNLSDLLDTLLRSGAEFSGSFLMFRKMLSTLEDVVQQVSPGESIQRGVVRYAVQQGFLRGRASRLDFKVPLKSSDLFQVGLSAQSFLPRVWAQSLRSLARHTGMGSSQPAKPNRGKIE
jgi:predicted unusual protein kinase regulating ubiquinone biosynthesis (AarF/ABC1/UbiB family)